MTTCPHAARVQAYTVDALPDDQMESVRMHLSVCEGCRQLAGAFALAESESADPAAVEALWRRIVPRLETPRPAKSPYRRLRVWAWAAVPVAATLALSIFLARPPETRLVLRAPVPPAAPSLDLPLLARLEAPPVELPLDDLLVTRGAGAAGLGPRLTAAFQAYQRGDYAGAARRFDELERKGSKRYEVFLYHGISLLMAGRPDEAAPPLRAAADVAVSGCRPQAQWFLAVALLNRHEVSAAREQLQAVCASSHERGPGACNVLRTLTGPER